MSDANDCLEHGDGVMVYYLASECPICTLRAERDEAREHVEEVREWGRMQHALAREAAVAIRDEHPNCLEPGCALCAFLAAHPELAEEEVK